MSKPVRSYPDFLDRARAKLMKYVRHAESGCWEWQSGRFPTGYGKMRMGRGRGESYAHRWAHLLFKGPIPEGWHTDHLCRNRGCVNPDHLQAVLPKENSRRGEAGQKTGAQYRARTHCPSGHPLDGRLKTGYRYCKECARRAALRHYWRKKATNG